MHSPPDYGDITRGKKHNRNPSAISGNNSNTFNNNNSSLGSFIPLKDLLRRNHGDRVQDYLQKMDDSSVDDVINPKEKTSLPPIAGGKDQAAAIMAEVNQL